jgi:hypothetical protein
LVSFLSLIVPLTFLARLSPAAGQFADRATTFLLIPLALAAAPRLIAVYDLAGVGQRLFVKPFVVAALTLAYMGGVLLGSGPDWERLPGPYLVSAENRSMDSHTLAAIEWSAASLPPGARIVADRVPADLLSSQARLTPVMETTAGQDPASLYFADSWGPSQLETLRALHLQYVYVDSRLSTQLPHVGQYFHEGETSTVTRLTDQQLEKFAKVAGIVPIYREGPITIYDCRQLSQTWRVPAPALAKQAKPWSGLLLGGLCGVALAAYLARRRGKQGTFATPLQIATLGVSAAIVLMAILLSLHVWITPWFTLAVLAATAPWLVRRVGASWAERRSVVHHRVAARESVVALICVLAVGLAIGLSWQSSRQSDGVQVRQHLQEMNR